MATTESLIEAALLGRVATLSFSPAWAPAFNLATQVAWPNAAFTPPQSGGKPIPYLRVFHIPNTVDQISLGDSGLNRYAGLFQVSVVWPLSVAASPAIEAAGQIAKHFKRGTVIANSGLHIRVSRPPAVARLIQEDTMIQVPVTVSWLCDAPNPN